MYKKRKNIENKIENSSNRFTPKAVYGNLLIDLFQILNCEISVKELL